MAPIATRHRRSGTSGRRRLLLQRAAELCELGFLFGEQIYDLARILLLLANFGKENESEHVIAPVSQETLAEMVGTTRSRVDFFMNKFRRLGFIDYNGGLEVHPSLLNIVLHD
jgi:CRP/FNR family transcriptional regulator, cyclic AMP receptor protein